MQALTKSLKPLPDNLNLAFLERSTLRIPVNCLHMTSSDYGKSVIFHFDNFLSFEKITLTFTKRAVCFTL